MSLPLQLTVPSLHRHNTNTLTKHPTTCVHKQFSKLQINRRTALVGLTLLPTLTTNQTSMASGVPDQLALSEFGSDRRQLTDTIRIIVPRPKISESGFSEEDTVEVLRVENVEIPNNEPVRFDVYVSKADGSSDLGEFAGSLIEEARLRLGRYFRRSGLSLGITNLVKRIGGENCDKLVVSLVPRTGDLSIGGVRIEHIEAS